MLSFTRAAAALMVYLSIAALSIDIAIAARTESSGPMSASACPALFGGTSDHDTNRHRRNRTLYWVRQDGRSVTLAHGSDHWQAPSRLTLVGAEVVTAAASQRAEVVLLPRVARRIGCRPGSYSLGRDASIAGGAVLSILAEGLLIERHGRLHFIGRRGTPRLHWTMIWGSRYTIAVSPTAAAGVPITITGRQRFRH